MAPAPIPVTLALQGGGSLGAFTWGVLDRLLDRPELRIEVVSGASAGALNAAMVVQGLATGGPEEAKRLLEALWRGVANTTLIPDLAGISWLFPLNALMTPVVDAMKEKARTLTKQQINPFGLNPLKSLVTGLLDNTVFGRDGAPTLVVSATRVSTGEARLFQDEAVTVDALLASACLPRLFPAVEIEGEMYWDGGYSSNPPLRQLIEAGGPSDLILVRTTPTMRPDVPTEPIEIVERADEIAFGSALRQELRSLALAQRLTADLKDPPGGLGLLKNARLHIIGAEAEFQALKSGSTGDPRWSFLSEMRELGQASADQWLKQNLSALGTRSSVDLAAFAGAVIDGPIGIASRKKPKRRSA